MHPTTLRPQAGRTPSWALFVLVSAAALAWLSTGFPNLFFEDDAYFYLQIAWQLASGHGPTFDGLHATSGFHLLWMGVLTPFARLVQTLGFGKPVFAGVAAALALTIAVGTSRRLFPTLADRLFVIALALFCGVTMEGTLAGALVGAVALDYLGRRRVGTFGLGLLAALVPLARVDYAWFAPLLVVGARWVEGEWPDAWRPMFVGTLAGVAAHVGIELAVFGHPFSVSSAYKADLLSRHGVRYLVVDNLRRTGNQLRFLFLGGFTLVAFVGRPRLSRAHVLLAAAWLPMLVYTGANYLRDWYSYVPLLVAALASRDLAGETSRLRTLAAAAFSALIVASSAAYLALNAGDWQRSRAFIAAANAGLPAGSVVYQVDGAGFPGWWLHVPLVNGDGLVNSWDYRDRWLRLGLGGYLRETGVTHILTNQPETVPPIDYRGLVVSASQVRVVADTGPMRNRRARLRLLRLSTPPR